MQKHLYFIAFGTLSAYAGPYMRTHMIVCVRNPKVYAAFIFQKQLYVIHKRIIFSINSSQFII